MSRLLLQSFWLLWRIDTIMRSGGDAAFLQAIRIGSPPGHSHQVAIESICRAINLASVFYYRPVLCLQKSILTVHMLRSHGYSADLVIGARIIPFSSHAWVEVGATPINEKPYVRELYQEIERY